MERSRFARWLPLAAVIGAVLGFAVRFCVLKYCTDDRHLLDPGSLGLLWLVLYAVAVTSALTLLVLRLPKRARGTDAAFTVLFPDWISFGCGGVFFVIALIKLDFEAVESTAIWLTVGALLAAALLAAAAYLRSKGKPVPFWLVFPVSVYAAAKLILDFKDWSFDPRVIDFCYQLFFDVSLLLSVHFMSGFTLKVGKPRAAILWSLLTVVFAWASLADHFAGWSVNYSAFFVMLGFGLICVTQAGQLLCKPFPPDPEPEPENENPAPNTDAATDTEPAP